MRILLDENLDWRLRRDLPGHQVEEDLDRVTPEVAKIFAAKEERRRALARLPFPEKVQAVMQLQEIAAVILQARGKRVRPWNLGSPGN